MTEQLKYRAQLKARGLDSTGVTEDHARVMAAKLGSHTMFIVEAIHDKLITDSEGNQQVTLRLTSVEPVPADLEDEVRDLQRALYRQRPDVLGQETLKGTAAGPTPKEATARALAAVPDAPDPGPGDDVWDGDPDAPAPGETCPAPLCNMPVDHDGDHGPADDD